MKTALCCIRRARPSLEKRKLSAKQAGKILQKSPATSRIVGNYRITVGSSSLG
jgi:hypothetical protein